MNNKRTAFVGATLLLVVGAVTLARYWDRKLYGLYVVMFHHDPNRFNSDDCTNMREYLAKGNTFSNEPIVMLKQLKDLENKTESPLQRDFAARLISYANLDCQTIKMDEFLAIMSICTHVSGLEQLFNFVDHFGRQKFLKCYRQILKSFKKKPIREEWLNRLHYLVWFIEVNINTDTSRLEFDMLYEHIRHVKNSFQYLEGHCTFYRDKVLPDLSIINVAREMGFVQEKELALDLPLLNKYVLFCVRYLDKEAPLPVTSKASQAQ